MERCKEIVGGGGWKLQKTHFVTFPWFKHILSKNGLKTREMLKMLKVFGPTDKNVLKTGEMLKMLKRLKVFWGIDPPPTKQKIPPNWGNVKSVNNFPEMFLKKCLKLGKH